MTEVLILVPEDRAKSYPFSSELSLIARSLLNHFARAVNHFLISLCAHFLISLYLVDSLFRFSYHVDIAYSHTLPPGHHLYPSPVSAFASKSYFPSLPTTLTDPSSSRFETSPHCLTSIAFVCRFARSCSSERALRYRLHPLPYPEVNLIAFPPLHFRCKRPSEPHSVVPSMEAWTLLLCVSCLALLRYCLLIYIDNNFAIIDCVLAELTLRTLHATILHAHCPARQCKLRSFHPIYSFRPLIQPM
jgi:hypothetical protein